jgi:hypothetical protein
MEFPEQALCPPSTDPHAHRRMNLADAALLLRGVHRALQGKTD